MVFVVIGAAVGWAIGALAIDSSIWAVALTVVGALAALVLGGGFFGGMVLGAVEKRADRDSDTTPDT